MVTPTGTLAPFASPATRQSPYRRLHSALSTFSGSLSDPGAYAHQLACPVTSADFSAAARVVTPQLDPHTLTVWGFVMTGSDGENATARVWGLHELVGPPDADADIPRSEQVEWLGCYLGEIQVTAGPAAVATGSRILPQGLFADTISVAADDTLSPGMRVIADTANGQALLTFDRLGFQRLVWEFKLGTCDSVGAFYREV